MKKYHIFEYQGEGSFEAWIKNMAEQSESALDKLNSQELFELILRLPEGYRAIFNLYEIEGFKHAEIAQKLGINIGTSKSQLSKAKAYLREMIIKLGLNHAS